MKEHQMYPNNPNSAESILTEKLKDVSYGWVDNQRAIVLEAMEQYAKSERNKVLDEAIEELSKCEDREQRKGHSLSEYAFKDAIFILSSLKVDL